MEEFFTKEEAAEKLKVSVVTVLRWLRAGALKGSKVGRSWRIKESDLESFMQGERNPEK
jgi:excisionase family DNA binding protein